MEKLITKNSTSNEFLEDAQMKWVSLKYENRNALLIIQQLLK